MVTAKAKPERSQFDFVGNWRIIQMEVWDQNYVDAEEPGHITFLEGEVGELHFGYVAADLDWEYDAEAERMDFTFDGFDEFEPTSGRGWAKFEGKQLVGEIAFHQGDRSGLKAKKGK